MSEDNVQRRLRSKFTYEISIKTDNVGLKSVKSQNISLNGLFVETNEKIPVGSECQVEISLDNEFVIEIEGKITRAASEGLGITFLSMGVESFEHLKKIVLLNSEEPDQILKQCTKRPGFK